ncbi:MAG TPA: UvrD-helicase domain-containing protein, partial [Polyangiaceae bacterium]|nr:UvrD-helicase domain-containing protein [Polyangiaceae bacterium]
MTDASREVDSADAEIAQCLTLVSPRSFFLFAGAGSGKTKSLENAIRHIQASIAPKLRLRGQRVGVITYTNAACDEIKSRIQFDPLIDVRTIHSFAWTLIDGFDGDIRDWLRSDIAEKLADLEKAEERGRRGTKASADRLRRIESRKKRLSRLD